MTSTAELLQDAREAFARGDWSAARERLTCARATGELDLADLDRLGRATWWLGDGAAEMSISETIYGRLLEEGNLRDAARRATMLCLAWGTRGDFSVAQGWLNRARRLVEQLPRGPERGYLTYVEAALVLEVEGDSLPAETAAAELTAAARDFDDPVLGCFARVLSGLAAVRSGRTTDGFGDLDEAMLPVLAGEVPPLWAGDIYCTVIHVCEALGDLARMRTWTDSLDQWASPLSQTFLYAGVTRIHQLQLVRAEGGWDAVERGIEAHSRQLVGSHGWLAAAGYYELGEVRRLRGD
ncbi:MAG TPA: helix-turn-helix transcriptional regulator, partial [Segeticoccus sp.]|nr:helix-turn-helix transcriptional regulator [Segeticoccus sp.]